MVTNISYGNKASRRSHSKGILLCVKNDEVDNLTEALIKLSIDGPMVSYEASSSEDDDRTISGDENDKIDECKFFLFYYDKEYF
ncbi:hypothetical protein F8M41_008571 [Gigaspora margarita]|uniref:Uncharacterized protein n=1 Tax=Gigaspora margarita TaxID=4874 RepID=A0A8H4AVM4_GIGMA|nr:hypothetical protein F8M41_008571 [Gigaspora margarita]